MKLIDEKGFMRHIYKTLLLLFLSISTAWGQAGTGSIKVIIENSDEVIGATVQVKDGERLVTGGITDPFGLAVIPGIEPGQYTLIVSYVGYKTVKQPVTVSTGNIREVRINMQESVVEGEEVVIYEEKDPLIEESYGGLETRGTDEILKNPTRGVNGILGLSGGVQTTDGSAPVIRGSRSSSNITYIDGIPVRGNASVPQSSYGEVQVYQSGVPAKFGDATGGVINITTRGISNNSYNRVEYITSEGLDGFGYNTLEVLSSGPLVRKVLDTMSNVSIPKFGYMISGTLNLRDDRDPSPIGVWRVNDNVIESIKQNPLRPSPIGSGFVSRSKFITKEDMTLVKVKPNTQSLSYNFNGKLDYMLADNVYLTFGGRARRFAGNDYLYDFSLLNFENNSEFTNETYSGYLRLKQRFETSETATIKNAGYSIQFDYTRFTNVRWDPNHQDDVFKYGHVGQFNRFQQSHVWDTRQMYANTDSSFNLFALYETETPFDTAVTFRPGTANPTSSNYTEQYYGFSNYDVRTLDEIQQNGALINGQLPSLVYSLWRDVGTPYTSYAKASEDQVSLNFNVNGSIKNHNIEAGFRYEERTLRSYGINAAGLWTNMRQAVNRHIRFSSSSLDSALFAFTDGTYRGYEINQAQGSFLDTVNFERTLNENQQTSFDRNFRNYLIENGERDVYGRRINQFSFINPDAYDPSTFQLSWFGADDLLQNGTVSYYGYNHLGERIRTLPSLEDYLDDIDNRLIAPYNPIYMAGYIQDEVTYKNLNLRLGVRVDRFDANQYVLKDEYSLYNIRTVDEVTEILEVDVPGNIEGDYKVYVDDPFNPTKVTGYRNGDNWYTADGSQTNDPSVIAQESNTGTIAPYTEFSSQNELNDVGLRPNAFEDYEPQINVMPRIAVSFPISGTAMFFANYDVLTQRPSTGNIATIDAYYYLPARSTGRIGNPNLRPEKTISYELGFQQQIGDNMALKIQAYYKELRDMIQVVPRRYAFPVDYTTFGNIDFGTVKGLILNYKLRPDPSPYGTNKNVTLEANYTLQFADATGSSATSQAAMIQANQPNLRTLQPTNNDVRHNFVVSFDYRFAGGEAYNGPITDGGKKILANTGLNVVMSTSSGRPYSGQKNVTQDVSVGVAQRRNIEGTVNGSRYPWLFNVNARLDKSWGFAYGVKTDEEGNAIGKPKVMNLNVYLWAQNLFNTRNIVRLYRYTGLPDDDGWLSSAQGQQNLLLQEDQQSYIDLYRTKVQNPNNFTRPRLIRLGVIVSF